MLPITSVFAALITLIYLALSFRVIAYRRGNQISLGDHGDKALETRIRAHANCAEYAPIGLILLGLVEFAAPPTFVVVILGIALTLGRLLHGAGFWGARPNMALRSVGMILTLLMMIASAIGLLGHGLI